MSTDSSEPRPVGGEPPRIALVSFGTVGDLRPFVLLAGALQQRGHRVRLVVPRLHEAMARASGLDWVAFGTPEQSMAVLDDPDLWHERRGFGVVWRGLLPSLDELHDRLEDLLRTGPCVVLSHPFLAPIVAMVRERRPELRLVTAYLSPSTLRTVHDPLTIGSLHVPRWVPTAWRRWLWSAIDRRFIDPDLLPGLNAARRVRALAPVAHFMPTMETVAQASIGLFPPWFAHRQPDWPANFVEGDFPLPPIDADVPQLPEALEAFLAAGDAPIAFTPGTGHKHAARYFANALEALQALGRRGVFVTAFPEQLPRPLPPEVTHVAQAPFERLLPRVALLVHHGGIGTTAEALRAGVPQLILPFAFDQFDNGRRVQALGAGASRPAASASARRLRLLIERWLAAGRIARADGGETDEQRFAHLLDRVEQALGLRRP